MLKPVDQYFLRNEEPVKSCLMALRDMLLNFDSNITEGWKYGMSSYCYKGKMCCYLWMHKKYKQPYLGVVEGNRINHPQLLIEKRARMKIILVDPAKDLPVKTLTDIIRRTIALYKHPET